LIDGDVFGEISFLKQVSASATITAAGQVGECLLHFNNDECEWSNDWDFMWLCMFQPHYVVELSDTPNNASTPSQHQHNHNYVSTIAASLQSISIITINQDHHKQHPHHQYEYSHRVEMKSDLQSTIWY